MAEIGLRLLGYRTWRYAGADRQDAPLHISDPVLGWTNKPGHYRLPPYVVDGNEIEVTILEDGSRATGSPPADNRATVVLLGCSVTFGWGLSDAQTYPWKLQQGHAELRVVNFGSSAQGTLQALLRMERIVALSPRPRLVLYGFFTRHVPRNVATYDWLRMLAQNSHRGIVADPYVTLAGEGGLERHPPQAFAVWPLAEWLVTARIAGDGYMRLVTHGREQLGPEATKRLMLEMTRVAREHSTPFAVVFLLAQPGKKEEYVSYFQSNDIPYVDCVEPFGEDDQIPVDGHPNERLNARWAQCIAHALPDLLADDRSHP